MSKPLSDERLAVIQHHVASWSHLDNPLSKHSCQLLLDEIDRLTKENAELKAMEAKHNRDGKRRLKPATPEDVTVYTGRSDSDDEGPMFDEGSRDAD